MTWWFPNHNPVEYWDARDLIEVEGARLRSLQGQRLMSLWRLEHVKEGWLDRTSPALFQFERMQIELAFYRLAELYVSYDQLDPGREVILPDIEEVHCQWKMVSIDAKPIHEMGPCTGLLIVEEILKSGAGILFGLEFEFEHGVITCHNGIDETWVIAQRLSESTIHRIRVF